GDDMKVSDRALNRLKAQAAHLQSPEEIRRIRKAFHLTQAQAGALIGGGPSAFQKYESGDLLPSKAISNFLHFLQLTPNASDILKKLSQMQKMGTESSPDQVREAQRKRA
ncbi:MAG: transcriptional regulator, family, partial [Firmicutes bacterium]|nr:transcriptional regulator, family [Bacillota bacterium]